MARMEKSLATRQMEVQWQKSPFCGSSACVEVAKIGDKYAIRDSKNPCGPVLRFAHAEWEAFVEGVLAGAFEFD